MQRPGFEGRKEMFYLTTHSTHFIYGYMASDHYYVLQNRSWFHKRNGHPEGRSSTIKRPLMMRMVVGSISLDGRKEGNVLFNDALNTFYFRLYDVGHMIKNHSDSDRGNPLPPHRLLFPISSKDSFICIILHTG